MVMEVELWVWSPSRGATLSSGPSGSAKGRGERVREQRREGRRERRREKRKEKRQGGRETKQESEDSPFTHLSLLQVLDHFLQ